MEHSPETNSPYYNTDDTAYYAGPLMYFAEDGNDIVELNSQKVVSVEEFDALYNNITVEAQYERPVVNNGEVSTMSTTGFNMETYYIDGILQNLTYNNEELQCCGPLAFATLLLWYDEYVADKYLSDFFASTPQALFQMLITVYFPEHTTTYETLCEGMESYFTDYSINDSAFSVEPPSNFNNFVFYTISSRKRPVIIGLYESLASSSQWSQEHWIMAYGIRDYYMDGQYYNREYIVNDGYGNAQVFITYSTDYMDGAISFNH